MTGTVETADADVVVIGAGPAGEVVAGRVAEAGLSVIVVERQLVGGECSYWGCIPSKTLIRPGDVLAAARRVPGAATAVVGGVDVPAAFARRDYIVTNYSDDGASTWLTDRKISIVRGVGRLVGVRAVEVDQSDGSGPVTLRAGRAVVLATGTRAAMPPIPGLAEAEPWDNRTATGATTVPNRLVVLGGGAVGCELAQVFRRFGSTEVTVVEGSPRLLGREEPFAGDEVRAAFEAEGIKVLTGRRVTSTNREPTSRDHHRGLLTVVVDDGSEIMADEILVAVGRRPATASLGLASVGLPDGGYVEVDDSMRAVGVDGGWLLAVGDVNGRALLTHMGKYQARVAADVVTGRLDPAGQPAREVAGRSTTPRVTFTDPQVCAVGLTEQQAREAGLDVRAVSVATGDVAAARTSAEEFVGTSKLVVDVTRRVLVGATFTGPGTQELLHAATVAVVGNVPLETLWHAVPSFPTVSEVWLRLLENYGL